MRILIAATLALAGTLASTAQAQSETRYVIEQVVVSVNSQADGAGERVSQIKSGDQVEVLERQDEQARIRVSSGEEGWVKASYLSESLPLAQQLKSRSDELEKVRKEKSQLETDLAAARKAAAAAAAAPPATVAAKPVAPAPAAAPPVTEPPPSPASSPQESASQGAPPLFSEDPMMPSRPTWLWSLGASILSLGVGFALGWRLLDRRIRAKYGGLRIY